MRQKNRLVAKLLTGENRHVRNPYPVWTDFQGVDGITFDRAEHARALARLERNLNDDLRLGQEHLEASLDAMNDELAPCDWCRGRGHLFDADNVKHGCTKCTGSGRIVRECYTRGEPYLMPMMGYAAWCAVRLTVRGDPASACPGSEQQALSDEPCTACHGTPLPGHVCLCCGSVVKSIALRLRTLREADQAARIACRASIEQQDRTKAALGARAKRASMLTFATRHHAKSDR